MMAFDLSLGLEIWHVQTAMLTFFTPSEANSLLPEVHGILKDLLAKKGEISRAIEGSKNHSVERTVLNEELQTGRVQELMEAIRRGVKLLEEMGCIVRQIDEGIVDFPAQRYGKQVYLCWRLGEPRVAYWHDMKSGFAGRSEITDAEVTKAYV